LLLHIINFMPDIVAKKTIKVSKHWKNFIYSYKIGIYPLFANKVLVWARNVEKFLKVQFVY
jgi:hypothetical protein